MERENDSKEGKPVNSSNTVINLHQETLGTDYANTKQLFFGCFFFAVPVLCSGREEEGTVARMSSQRKLDVVRA